MAKRDHISKRVRFEVFKRDGFRCQYCGSHPPEVKLHVDHIHPVKLGGRNNLDNLITACQACNGGKGPIPLTSVPQSLADKAVDIAEREAQIQGYYSVLRGKAERIENEAWDIVHLLRPRAKEFRGDWFLSIKRFLDYLDYFTVVEAMELAVARKPWSESEAFRYFCGICWKKIRGE